jgi:hypothetical protein
MLATKRRSSSCTYAAGLCLHVSIKVARGKRIIFLLPIPYSLEIFTGRCPNRAWGGVVVKVLRY